MTLPKILGALALAFSLAGCQTNGGWGVPSTTVAQIQDSSSVFIDRYRMEWLQRNNGVLFWVVDDPNVTNGNFPVLQSYHFTGPENLKNIWGKRERILRYTIESEANGDKASLRLAGVGSIFIKETKDKKLYCTTFANEWVRCLFRRPKAN